jgi:hypothetical protein
MAKLLERLDCATTKLGEKSVNGRCHEYPGMVKRSSATACIGNSVCGIRKYDKVTSSQAPDGFRRSDNFNSQLRSFELKLCRIS